VTPEERIVDLEPCSRLFFPIAASAGTFPLRLEQFGAGQGGRGAKASSSIGLGCALEHVPEKHALGLDPMGGNRFSEKDMRSLNNLKHMPIQPNRHVL
jgi:hypothetical protein